MVGLRDIQFVFGKARSTTVLLRRDRTHCIEQLTKRNNLYVTTYKLVVKEKDYVSVPRDLIVWPLKKKYTQRHLHKHCSSVLPGI